MAKRVFFSFHYQDVSDFRANVVRNSWLTKPDREAAGFFDASIWEKAKKDSPLALKRLINSAIKGTSATCVLIGTSTYLRPWIRYEIMRSLKKGNSICGVHINSITGKDGKTKALGKNPFDYLGVQFSQDGSTATLYEKDENGEWKLYEELESSVSYTRTKVLDECRNKFFRLSQFCKVYDWSKDDGYNNFANWV